MNLNSASAWTDLVWSEAERLHTSALHSDRHKDHIIPEYRPDAYDISGIRVYASSDRQPRASVWTWALNLNMEWSEALMLQYLSQSKNYGVPIKQSIDATKGRRLAERKSDQMERDLAKAQRELNELIKT